MGLSERLEGSAVITTEPLPYLAFLGLEAEARVVVTDSGGVPETSALGVRCFTLRETTERPVTVELGSEPYSRRQARAHRRCRALARRAEGGSSIPLWDGQAGVRAAEAIMRFLHAQGRVVTGAHESVSRGLLDLRVWVDIENPPQVQYLVPFVHAFERGVATCS